MMGMLKMLGAFAPNLIDTALNNINNDVILDFYDKIMKSYTVADNEQENIIIIFKDPTNNNVYVQVIAINKDLSIGKIKYQNLVAEEIKNQIRNNKEQINEFIG